MNRRLTQRGRERRLQLMEFAARRFAENGYHPTSVAEIVDELEVGKGVFYWYFSSKEELFNEILRDSQYALRRRQQHLINLHWWVVDLDRRLFKQHIVRQCQQHLEFFRQREFIDVIG